MKLSMWILADWLKKYNPQINIKDGRRTLRNVRLLSENVKMESMDVYMGAMKNFVDGNSAQVICVAAMVKSGTLGAILPQSVVHSVRMNMDPADIIHLDLPGAGLNTPFMHRQYKRCSQH